MIKKIILFIVLLVIVIAIVYIVLPKQSEEVEDVIIYTSQNFSLTLPLSWQDYYTIKTKDDTTSFSYKAEDNAQALLLIIREFPASNNLYSILSMPNHKIIAQTMDIIYTISLGSDVPYVPGDLGFERYLLMTQQIDQVISSIKPNAEIYALTKNIYGQNEQDQRDIDISYPEIPGEETVNQIIKQEMQDIAAEFKDNVEQWGDVFIPEGAYSAIVINYQPKLLNKELASIYFTISESMAGAAHPNSYNYSLNFDLETNKKIELNDLFNTQEQVYLARLSKLVLANLKAQFIKRDMDPEGPTLQTGTEPKKENFGDFNITGEGIVFNFSPYQVAAYAAGQFFVLIPFEDLEDIILSKFVQ